MHLFWEKFKPSKLNTVWILALPITLILFFSLPFKGDKYKLELVKKEYCSEESLIYFEDLNNDQIDEKIVIHPNNLKNASYFIFNKGEVLFDQWNYNEDYLNSRRQVFFTDLNKDGYQEITLFTYSHDSIFLNINQPFGEKAFEERGIYVDRIGNFDPNRKYQESHALSCGDLQQAQNSNGNAYAFFTLNAGFSGYPRNVYRYSLAGNEIIKSEHLGNRAIIYGIGDYDKDNELEITLGTNSVGNSKWFDSSYYKRSDESNWLMVLNEDLEFDFSPLEFPSVLSVNRTLPIAIKDTFYYFTTYVSRRPDETPSEILKLDTRGNILERESFQFNSGYAFYNEPTRQLLIFNNSKGLVKLFNTSLKEIKTLQINRFTNLKRLKTKKDEHPSWLQFDSRLKILHIWTNDLENHSSLQLDSKGKGLLRNFGIRYFGKDNLLWIQDNGDLFFVKYSRNALYFLKYPYYLGLYLIVVLSFYFVQLAQRTKLEKERGLENKISELQLKSLKNQLDPHFVFNALNSIAEMKLLDKDEVDDYLCEFSNLMRKTIGSSDAIVYSLSEEISYIKNYISLQKVALLNAFDFQMTIDPEIDLDQLIPKHLLYIYIENAIKHGFSGVRKGGLLKVGLKRMNESIKISIQDNGLLLKNGRTPSRELNKSTGTGLRVMQEIIELYEERFERKISIDIIDQIRFKDQIGFMVIIQMKSIPHNTHK